jgi:NAD(P)-dependent dehydrogenase (short-subunit alcohol dehydrogenase family)
MGILAGKKGLIMGVANERSAAWGIAEAAAAQGAELAFTYQIEGFKKRLEPLAASIESDILIECDVAAENGIKSAFTQLRQHWDQLDFAVHAIGFSDKSELKGPYYNTSRDNFEQTLLISAFSFTELAAEARHMMPEQGGSLLTLSYLGGGQSRAGSLNPLSGGGFGAAEYSGKHPVSRTNAHPCRFCHYRGAPYFPPFRRTGPAKTQPRYSGSRQGGGISSV